MKKGSREHNKLIKYQVLLFFPHCTAIRFDGVDVFGYSAWSLVDGFEWNKGYEVRRGLFYIDFNQPNRSRTPKTSAQYYRHVIAHNGFPRDKTSGEVAGRFPCGFHWGIADATLQVGGQNSSKLVIFLQKILNICPQPFVFCVCGCRCTSTLSRHNLPTAICTTGT